MNINLSDYSEIKTLLTRHGFNFSKSLGQNFIVNPDVCPFMAENCGADRTKGVLEIGPGIGVLTKELSYVAKKVVSIELDSSLFPILAETLDGFENVKVVYGDALKLDMKKLIEEEFDGMDVVVCANLPYYITSPIIMKLLESGLPFSAITVMIQKEFADRICAPVGSRNSGAVTIAVRYYAEPVRLLEVGKGSFHPQPKVDSAVVRLDMRETPPVKVNDEKKFFALVKAAFSMRRKTALNGISNGLGIPKEKAAEALEKCGIPLNERAEKFTMEQLADLSNALNE